MLAELSLTAVNYEDLTYVKLRESTENQSKFLPLRVWKKSERRRNGGKNKLIPLFAEFFFIFYMFFCFSNPIFISMAK